jgi:curved DNA-binding protein
MPEPARMSQKDPYDILGVSRNASQDEIKRAYRRLAKQYHPDRNPGNKNAETQFKEVQAAYEVLGDPKRRAQYDQFGAGGPRPDFQTWTTGGVSPFEGFDFDFASAGDLSSVFEQFFRRSDRGARARRTSRRPAPRGADLDYAVDLSFEEAARGTLREIRLASTSAKAGSERIEFRVPAGVADGQRIRVKGKGHEGPGGRGDLMILCRVKPHLYFRRDGNDILLDLPLSLTEAVRGAKIEIPTLDGITRVTVPPGTSGGTKLRLRGTGIRGQHSPTPGDMYVITRIAVPKDLSPRAAELLDQLADELKQRPRDKLGWPQ